MPDLKPIRLSTGLISGTLYHVVRDAGDPRKALLITSDRIGIKVDEASLFEAGFYPHPDYVIETDEGTRLLIPPTLPSLAQTSYSRFLSGDLPPCTLRAHFNAVRSYLEDYVWLPDPVHLDLAAVMTFTSYLVIVFPAIPIIEIRGPVGSGKSTLLHALSHVCRSRIFTSNSTVAGLARARCLDPCTVLLDEPLRDPNHPVVLASYKRDSIRLIAGSNLGFVSQSLYGLTLKVLDGATEPLKDRTITIDIVPTQRSLTPFLSEREQERISRLTDNALWLSLTQFQGVVSEYESFLKEAPLTGRPAEKWAPIIAIARQIDASDTDQDPIAPGLETMMAAQIQEQREERIATDPSLLVLAGTQAYLAEYGADFETSSPRIVASDLAQYVSRFTDTEVSIQRVGFFLRTHNVLSRTFRSRNTESCVNPVSSKHPQTVFEIDLRRLEKALATYGMTLETDREPVEE